jgi:hypothetical protein
MLEMLCVAPSRPAAAVCSDDERRGATRRHWGTRRGACALVTNWRAGISCWDPVVAHAGCLFTNACGPPHRRGRLGVRRVRWRMRSTARNVDAPWWQLRTPSGYPRWMPSRHSIGRSSTFAPRSHGYAGLASTRCIGSVRRTRRHPARFDALPDHKGDDGQR